MITTAFVHIWGKTVGAVAWNQNTGLAGFECHSPDLTCNFVCLLDKYTLTIEHLKKN